MSGERVDVRAVMDAAIESDKRVFSVARIAMRDARDAVAALIEADRAFDLSRANLTEVSNRIVSGSRSDNDFREQTNAQHAYDRAAERRAAALSRIQPDGQG